MANERKTESIVRKHFDKFSDVVVEEQKSENVKINKLLQNASKKGSKHGNPEFIISFDNNSNFIIVTECKPDVKKHESKTHDKYADYAVDGALLYASFLSKEYDVLAIAVSGENNGMYGKRHSTDAKMKISKRLTGKTAWNKGIEKPNYFKTRLENAVRTIIDTYKLTTNDFLKSPDVFIQKAKNDGVIWKNLGISSSTIIDYGIELK